MLNVLYRVKKNVKYFNILWLQKTDGLRYYKYKTGNLARGSGA